MLFHNKKIIIPCILSVLTIIGCGQQNLPEKNLNEKFNFNEEVFSKTIENRFSEESFIIFYKDSSFEYLDTLKQLYKENNFKPFFLKSFEEEDFVDSLIILFERANEHGLNPELYHLRLIAAEFYESINDTIQNPERIKQLADSEIFIADAVLKYAYHMRYGVINPKKLFPNSYTIPVIDTSDRDITEPLRQNDILKYLVKIQPKSERYIKLQSALKVFNKYKGIDWQEIKISSAKLQPGSKDSSVILIVERLITLGFLDTSKVKINDLTVYDSSLVEPIKKFQRLRGLNDDGIIGKATVELLNITPHEYLTTIKLNLERFRWNNYTDSSRYILVNIPDFKLYAVENGKEKFNIKVCVGSKRSAGYKKRFEIYKKSKKYYDKPDDWETPCLFGEISYLVLNPTWTVPASIIREEIAREMKKDSSYLSSKNFKVYQDGVELNLSEVNIQEFSSEKIPYTIVQNPGAGNALGKIKFMFKNPFGVYLHDTPSRVPFSYSNRAVSHGCVRLEKPLMFAEYILKDHSLWNTDFLKIEIGQKPDDKKRAEEYKLKRSELRKNRSFGKTTEIVLDKPLPLFIDYFTSWVDADGEINFRQDVYGKDKILTEHILPDAPGELYSYTD